MPAGMFSGLAGLDLAALGIPSEAGLCRRLLPPHRPRPPAQPRLSDRVRHVPPCRHPPRHQGPAGARQRLVGPCRADGRRSSSRWPSSPGPGTQPRASELARVRFYRKLTASARDRVAIGASGRGSGDGRLSGEGPLSVDQPRRRWAPGPDPLPSDERPTVEGVVRELRAVSRSPAARHRADHRLGDPVRALQLGAHRRSPSCRPIGQTIPIATDAERALYDVRELTGEQPQPVEQDNRIILVPYTQDTLAATGEALAARPRDPRRARWPTSTQWAPRRSASIS